MNILVTGANGQLGMSIRRATKDLPDNYIFADIAELDITDKGAIEHFVDANDIDIIVNCAAYTNVEKAEDDQEMAELLNATAVGYLAEAMARKGGLLIHISTDYVFGGGGANTPCAENQPANPTGVYGLTKLHGEEEILKSGVRHIILRTAWLYSEYGNNFVKTMLRLTNEKSELKVVFDQVGTPTYAGDLADAITEIINRRLFNHNTGIYHFSNEGVCSWYDFTKRIAEQTSANEKCDIRPCHSDEFPSKVKRPSYSVLDKTKFKTDFCISIPYWTDSLRKCIKNLKS